MKHGSTTRFSDRVADYVKYRPGYPHELVEELSTNQKLGSGHRVADIGSGTGIFSEVLLRLGCEVVGVEPNQKMREAGDDFLKDFPRFQSREGTSDRTGLENQSVDFIFAAQAFHWFDPTSTRTEFLRILKPQGKVGLIWNERRISDTAFARAYEALIQRFATDYNQINHANLKDDQIIGFFGQTASKHVFHYSQVLDFEGLLGRLASSSYVPKSSDPQFSLMKDDLTELFARHQVSGRVTIVYDTKMYLGSLA